MGILKVLFFLSFNCIQSLPVTSKTSVIEVKDSMAHLASPHVQKVCGSRDNICKSNITNVCAMRILNEITEYMDFENECYLFLSNMCDQPGEEFHILVDDTCENYNKTNINKEKKIEHYKKTAKDYGKSELYNESDRHSGNSDVGFKSTKKIDTNTQTKEYSTAQLEYNFSDRFVENVDIYNTSVKTSHSIDRNIDNDYKKKFWTTQRNNIAINNYYLRPEAYSSDKNPRAANKTKILHAYLTTGATKETLIQNNTNENPATEIHTKTRDVNAINTNTFTTNVNLEARTLNYHNINVTDTEATDIMQNINVRPVEHVKKNIPDNITLLQYKDIPSPNSTNAKEYNNYSKKSKKYTKASQKNTQKSVTDTQESSGDTEESQKDTKESKKGKKEKREDTHESQKDTKESEKDTKNIKQSHESTHEKQYQEDTIESQEDTNEKYKDKKQRHENTNETQNDGKEGQEDTKEIKGDTKESQEDTKEKQKKINQSQESTNESREDTKEKKKDTEESQEQFKKRHKNIKQSQETTNDSSEETKEEIKDTKESQEDTKESQKDTKERTEEDTKGIQTDTKESQKDSKQRQKSTIESQQGTKESQKDTQEITHTKKRQKVKKKKQVGKKERQKNIKHNHENTNEGQNDRKGSQKDTKEKQKKMNGKKNLKKLHKGTKSNQTDTKHRKKNTNESKKNTVEDQNDAREIKDAPMGFRRSRRIGAYDSYYFDSELNVDSKIFIAPSDLDTGINTTTTKPSTQQHSNSDEPTQPPYWNASIKFYDSDELYDMSMNISYLEDPKVNSSVKTNKTLRLLRHTGDVTTLDYFRARNDINSTIFRRRKMDNEYSKSHEKTNENSNTKEDNSNRTNTENTNEKSKENSHDKTKENSDEENNEKSSDKSKENSNKNSEENSKGQHKQNSNENSSEKSKEISNEKTGSSEKNEENSNKSKDTSRSNSDSGKEKDILRAGKEKSKEDDKKKTDKHKNDKKKKNDKTKRDDKNKKSNNEEKADKNKKNDKKKSDGRMTKDNEKDANNEKEKKKKEPEKHKKSDKKADAKKKDSIARQDTKKEKDADDKNVDKVEPSKDGFKPIYDIEETFDGRICPLDCPKAYNPVCITANRGYGLYLKYMTFVNQCAAYQYYCKNWKIFGPPPKSVAEEEEENVDASPLSWSYCGSSRYLSFARFAEVASSMGYYGWLAGNYKATHIMEPHERIRGYGRKK